MEGGITGLVYYVQRKTTAHPITNLQTNQPHSLNYVHKLTKLIMLKAQLIKNKQKAIKEQAKGLRIELN